MKIFNNLLKIYLFVNQAHLRFNHFSWHLLSLSPIFSNNNSISNNRNDSNIHKMKEINKIIETNPYSYIFDGGYITAPVSFSGTYKERIVVTNKKPSLNNAAAFMGKTAAELISKKN